MRKTMKARKCSSVSMKVKGLLWLSEGVIGEVICGQRYLSPRD